MSSFASLLLLCVSMFVGSLSFAYVPICLFGTRRPSASGTASASSQSFTISSSSLHRLQYANALGAGLFIGTAFSIIIPEGAQLLLSHVISSNADKNDDDVVITTTMIVDEIDRVCALPHAFGLPICLGFILMLIVDRIAHGDNEHSHDQTRVRNRGHSHSLMKSPISTAEIQNLVPVPPNSVPATENTASSSAFIGLLVHCAADGVALGAVSLAEHSQLEMIVFVALMMHKAPAAFGLSAFLLQQKQSKFRIWRLLLLFSGSAPLAAIITYIICVDSPLGIILNNFTLGMLMLFSAGTFLFVSCVHILPEIMGSRALDWSLLVTICVGIVLPSLIDSGHAHEH